MALFEGLMNCGQNLMDQDWNHWKLQMHSWMEDMKEQERQAKAEVNTASSSTAGGPQSCGGPFGPRRAAGCCGTDRGQSAPLYPGLDSLHELWSQFSGAAANGGPQRQSRRDLANQVNNDRKKLVIKLDMTNFEAQEITVKIVDNFIVVAAEHPERADRLSLISRRFQRRYELPEDVEADTIVSTLTPDGVLIIEGLKKTVQPEAGAEVVIPVMRQQTNGSTTDASADGNNKQDSYENEDKMD